MAGAMRATTLRTRSTERARSRGLMAESISDSGKMGNSTEKEFSSLLRVKGGLENGKRVEE